MMQLKPCPFCGCKQILIRREKGGFKISCSQCYAFMIRLAKHADPASQDQAYQSLLNRWNHRTHSGMYHYDLTAAETNADIVTVPPEPTETDPNRNQETTQ